MAVEDVAEFVSQNLLPLVTPMTWETLRLVKEDGRPVVVAVLESDSTPEAKDFIKKLKMAAPAFRKFVFTYVVGPEWPEFLRPFYIRKDTKLPTVFVWDDDTFVLVSLLTTTLICAKRISVKSSTFFVSSSLYILEDGYFCKKLMLSDVCIRNRATTQIRLLAI